MNTWIIIQARMGSRRLPGKAMVDIVGKPMLHRVIDRCLRALDQVIVATTDKPEDDAIAAACKGQPVRVFRGADFDVLGRFIAAAADVKAEGIVRVTGDCPLIDPDVILAVGRSLNRLNDYASNVFPRSYPKGLDCEAMWVDVLHRLDRISTYEEREHVTAAIHRCPELFKIVNVTAPGSFNWSVDTQEDLERVRKLYAAL